MFRNGLRHKLFGSFNGTIHGRVPQEQATLVIQKYGYAASSTAIGASVRTEKGQIVLTELQR
ncbi:hypothetical protein CO112_03940 [Candidatus Dojkabacteria bacterium CG_4_9_14_3_um_filter_150_Dojkabacteria_WS6_41_13]|uniref:Uncharacterized protein n=1 Tax=Candidatus Dojkabacteria bacterium CG_4_10_14_0_2_um_filter_Dojkabacteria_WS6_41_15 TaxID=2014249 RepID=A0A2M7W141_9BACT|nr:MAG: hypothetical protein COZ14_04095 [Candidatus Dojkabacteria bacterium CG_4_10_14_3_um_filter_Dojkabacteria_WS6_41_9]PJA12858.1 MAG: hypothetical protein COX64_03995 [Candidatus Dojkabacteria bacterium CG_4_10_14_0_2_um_filter_Dojkabacteria_WS6_41_15]PJB22517.1 MAG: hypothetical protein CO112_03940 [Candidatus Dojkabacteria bacterium CG_4_9_14_3_um_filter_150_Dojkabacteria_WS6_41_13]